MGQSVVSAIAVGIWFIPRLARPEMRCVGQYFVVCVVTVGKFVGKGPRIVFKNQANNTDFSWLAFLADPIGVNNPARYAVLFSRRKPLRQCRFSLGGVHGWVALVIAA